jgi:PST family polysaccharide transporter
MAPLELPAARDASAAQSLTAVLGPAKTTEASTASVDRQLVSGLAWTGAIKWLGQLVTWPIMLVLARLLSPSDFGYMALVSVWTRLLLLLTEGGFGAAIVMGPALPVDTLRQLNALAVLLSFLGMVVASAISHSIASFYHSPNLALVTLSIAGTFLFEGMMLVPAARLRREMRFRELALADLARAFTDSSITLALALAGARYWSLVGGYAGGVIVASLVIVSRCPTALRRPRRSAIEKTVRYAAQLLVPNVSFFLYSSTDVLIAGRLTGPAAVGAYGFAGTIASIPADKVTSVFTRVSPSILGTVSDEVAALRRYVLGLTNALALLLMPVFVGVAVIAPGLVSVVLGPQWFAVVMPLRLLCVHAVVTALTPTVSQTLQIAGDARRVSQNSLLALILYPTAFLLFGRVWGIAGIAAGWAVITPLLTSRLVFYMCRTTRLRFRQYLGSFFVPACASALMVVVLVLTARMFAGTHRYPAVEVIAQVLLGGLAYVAAVVALDRRVISRFVSIAKLVSPFQRHASSRPQDHGAV